MEPKRKSKAPSKEVKSGKRTASKKVSIKQIEKRAHLIYLNRVKLGLPGDEESDWLQAEEELNV